jgi:peptide/nickel transport system substrate-binding protein
VKRLQLLALVLIALSAGCSQANRPAGSFTIAQQWEPRSLNPALENGTSSSEWGLLVFSYLVKYDDRGQLIPDVATMVPTLKNGGISPDGLTITYHIRKGVRFADGVALTAADCAWSIDAINNPANNVQTRFAYDDVQRADAPDPSTLVLHLKHPFPPLTVVVEAPQGFPILPKHALASLPDFNHADFDSAPFGSGPYRVKRWARGDRVELEANPYYWQGTVGIPNMTILFVNSPQTAINLMHTREVDGYFDEQDYANYSLLKTIPGFHVTSTQENAVGSIIFNTQDPITKDPLVRHALAEAVDIPNLIARAYRGALQSNNAGAGLFLWAFDPAVYPNIPFDPGASRALLDAAGWRLGPDGYRSKDGHPLDVQLIIQAARPGDAAIANNVVQYEKAVGALVTVKQFNITQFVAPSGEGGPVYGGKFQMALYDFENGDDPDTTDQFACKNVPPNGYNKSRLCNAQVDALLKQGLSTYDPAKRAATYRTLQAVLYKQLPIALIFRRAQLNTFSDRLQNQTTSLSGAFWNVWHWHLAGAGSAGTSDTATAASTTAALNAPIPLTSSSPENCKPRIFPAAGSFVQTTATLHGPGLLLQGGGSDIDDAHRWMHRTLTGSSTARGGNVIVIRAYTDEDEYAPYIQPLGPFQSVQMLGIPHCATADQVDALAPMIERADAVFFAGGDQSNYVIWKGSKLVQAIRRLWDRGGVIGGTSAGLAVQGDVIYDSVAADRLHPNDDSYEVDTKTAVPNPTEPEISFTTGYFAWPPLADVVTDTHFARRDRFGRSVVFLSLVSQKHLTPSGKIYGVAVDERSALVVDKHGIATLLEYGGSGYKTKGAYILTNIHVTQLQPGKPLIATVHVLHLYRPGQTVNLFTKQGQGHDYDVTVDGTHAHPYSRDPYDAVANP